MKDLQGMLEFQNVQQIFQITCCFFISLLFTPNFVRFPSPYIHEILVWFCYWYKTKVHWSVKMLLKQHFTPEEIKIEGIKLQNFLSHFYTNTSKVILTDQYFWPVINFQTFLFKSCSSRKFYRRLILKVDAFSPWKLETWEKNTTKILLFESPRKCRVSHPLILLITVFVRNHSNDIIAVVLFQKYFLDLCT